MPELPEVETLRRGLAELIINEKIDSVDFNWAKSFPNSEADVEHFLIGSSIKSVHRRAKVLQIDLSSDYSLLIHLKMTGQLVFVSKKERFGAGHPNASLIGLLPDKSTRVMVIFKSGAVLYFNDQRKFGWMKLVPTLEIPSIEFFKKLGPEPLADDFSDKKFHLRLIKRKSSNIKAVLLDQSIIAGIGNIYADESLWGAKIHPTRLVSQLSKSEISMLLKEIKYVLNLSIEKGGSSDRNYVDAKGKKGSYMHFARVFRRENLPCPRCGTTIIKTKVAGRGTHICPHCQKIK